MRKSSSAPAMQQRRHSQAGQSRRGCLVIVPLVGGVLLLLLAVTLIIFLGVRQAFLQQETNAMPLEVVKLTPLAIPTVSVSAPTPLPPPPQSCETIISSGDVAVAASLPISLTVGGEAFPVVAIVAGEEGWTYPAGYPGTAAWICGTVVNYVLGLEPTPENETLLLGLRPGDEIKMYLSNGVVLFFRFTERSETEADATLIFEQIRPRLTLILEKQDGGWQVAVADYASETAPVPPVGTISQPGQPVRVGDAQVTVIEGHAEHDGSDLVPGTMYYLVEFSVENVGTTPLDAVGFSMQLQDDVGNVYLLSPEASAAGAHGLLDGEIGVGVTMQGTAGYLVPETLSGPALIWTFTPWPGSGLATSVSIPYETSAGESPVGGKAEVTLDEDGTFLSSDSSLLIIGGTVRNVGDEPLTVELSNISLTSSAGMSPSRSAAPPLPWTIQPGETQIFELQYEKPDASTALLMILGYSFEIRGLR